MVSAADPLELTVFGYAGDAGTLTSGDGSYRATITATTVTAIPEPQTWALMLAGMLVLGLLRSRWQRSVAGREAVDKHG